MAADSVAQTAIIASGPGIPSWAFAVSALAIIGAAIYGAFWQRAIARKNATFRTLMDQLWDKDYIEQRQTFIAISENDGGSTLEALGRKEKEDDEKSVAIRSIMNNYELMAIGLKNDILDEQMYVEYWRTTAVKDFERMKPYISEVRKNRPLAYVEFEVYYEKWRNK